MPEDGVECESFIVISTDSSLVYKEKYYLEIFTQLCLCNCRQRNDRLSWRQSLLKLKKISFSGFKKWFL